MNDFGPVKSSERRWKRLGVAPEYLLNLIQLAQHPRGDPPFRCFQLMRLNLPEGVRVLGVYAEWQSHLVWFNLEHESFEPVPDGHEIPPLLPFPEYEAVEIACEQPGRGADEPYYTGGGES